MPTAVDILKILGSVANNYSGVAIGWHVLILIMVVLLAFKWRPSNSLMSAIVCLPVVSVGVLNFMEGNPFNGIVFSVLAVLFLFFGYRGNRDSVKVASVLPVIAGSLMVIYGFFYPHFLEGTSLIAYLYAAPTGLIPCPTLALLIGFAMIFDGFKSKGWSLTLIAAGIFYGGFGIFRLKVTLDIVLLAGTLLFLVQFLFSINFKRKNRSMGS